MLRVRSNCVGVCVVVGACYVCVLDLFVKLCCCCHWRCALACCFAFLLWVGDPVVMSVALVGCVCLYVAVVVLCVCVFISVMVVSVGVLSVFRACC